MDMLLVASHVNLCSQIGHGISKTSELDVTRLGVEVLDCLLRRCVDDSWEFLKDLAHEIHTAVSPRTWTALTTISNGFHQKYQGRSDSGRGHLAFLLLAEEYLREFSGITSGVQQKLAGLSKRLFGSDRLDTAYIADVEYLLQAALDLLQELDDTKKSLWNHRCADIIRWDDLIDRW